MTQGRSLVLAVGVSVAAMILSIGVVWTFRGVKSAAAAAVAVTPKPRPIVPVTYAPVQKPDVAPLAPQTALELARVRLAGSTITQSSLGAPPAGPPSRERAGVPWLYVTVKVPGLADAVDIKSVWEADLLEGAVVELSADSANLHDALGGATFKAKLPSGEVTDDVGAGMGDVARGQQFARAQASVEEIRSDLSTTLAGFDLEPVSIQVLHPLGAAPAVIATSADPAQTARQYNRLVKALFGRTPVYEGYYLELRTPAGVGFVRASASFRTGAGRCWISSSYRPITTLVCGVLANS
jgi:hypothetical protein